MFMNKIKEYNNINIQKLHLLINLYNSDIEKKSNER